MGRRSVTVGLISAVLGSVVYRIIIALALRYNILSANALKLLSAVIVGITLSIPAIKAALEDRMKTKISLLSGGQRQAVTLLMATISAPKLLLLDEHTAALDPVTAEKVLTLTRDIVSRGKITTRMITHNITSALSLGTRTLMLEQGKIVLDLSGPQREALDVAGLMDLYREKRGQELDNDRMLLS